MRVKYDDNLAPEVRRKSIGGSDSAAIMGCNAYKSSIDLWLEKTGAIEPKDLSDNEFIYWGKTLESVVAQEFEKRSGKKTLICDEVIYSDEIPYLSANLDREIDGEDAILECKTTNAYNYKEWEDDEIPLSYIFQVQHYLLVTGKQTGYIACLIGGNKFVWKSMERDDELIEIMKQRYAEFWHCVETNTMPESDNFNATAETIKALYPSEKKGAQISVKPIEADIDLLQQKKAQKKEIESEIDALEIKIKSYIGENETGYGDTYTVTWKSQNSERLDTKKLKEDLPDVASKYLKVTQSRVMRIKENK